MNSIDKKVSIVVPIYNREKFLDKCISSLLKQTYKNIEIILVDDGSKDNSLDICNSYAKNDNRIKVIHKENGGVQSARNRGIDEATGYYLCFTDADDYVSDKFIENFIKVYESGEYHCVVCGFYKVDQDDNILLKNDNLINLNIPLFESERWALYFERFGCYVWNHMFITELVRKYNVRFDKDVIIFDDTAFTMNYLNHIDSIGFTNSNDYYYVCEHDDLTVAKRLKNKRVNDGGCREKVKTCIIKYEKYVLNKDINDIKNGNLKWVSSVLYYEATVSFVLYMSTVYNDYRYDKDKKNDMFKNFYYYIKDKKISKWYHKYEDLKTNMLSVLYIKPIVFLYNHLSISFFKLICSIMGCDFIHDIRLYVRRKRKLW